MSLSLVRRCRSSHRIGAASPTAKRGLNAVLSPWKFQYQRPSLSTMVHSSQASSSCQDWCSFRSNARWSYGWSSSVLFGAGCKRQLSDWRRAVPPSFISYHVTDPRTYQTISRSLFSQSQHSHAFSSVVTFPSASKGQITQETSDGSADSQSDDKEATQPSTLFKRFENKKLNLLMHVDMEELKQMASKRCTPLSLKDMYKYAVLDVKNPEQRLWNAQFLHTELPIRMAQRAYDLLTLPHGLNEAPAILQVAHVYLLYLEQFEKCPVPDSVESEEQFTNMLKHMILERSSIPNAIAKGVDTWAARHRKDNGEEMVEDSLSETDTDDFEEDRLREMEEALYRFFTARVGLRFLTQHHIMSSPKRLEGISTSTPPNNSEEDEFFLGCIQTNCEPVHEVRKVVKYVQKQTQDYYGTCPEIQIIDAASSPPYNESSLQKGNFTYVPHHLRYMVGELLKNSCRATLKRHVESGGNGEMPPIRIVIVKGEEDVTIKLADRGGGIPRSKMSKIWKFAHSTAARDENETDFGVDEFTGAKIRGFGLPLARIYARYLGGELTLKSLEGYGVDAYLQLPRLGDSCENLPLQVRYSPSNLNSNAPKKAVKSSVGGRD